MSKIFKTIAALPLYDLQRNQPPVDGMISKTPSFCHKFYDQRCRDFYSKIKLEGTHECPFGFSVRSFVLNGKIVFFSGIAIGGHYNHRKLKDGDRLPAVTLTDEFVNGCVRQIKQFQDVRREYNNLRKINNLLDETIHEVRNFNAQIKANCERIVTIQGNDKNLESKMRSLSQSNFSICQMTTSRLNYLSYNTNPAQSSRKILNLYKKTDKVVKSIAALAKSKQIKITMSGSSKAEVNAYDFFELIPAVFVQNAVKYGLDSSEITVKVEEKDEFAVLSVQNVGPAILPDEKEKIFYKGFRGQNAKLVEGTGQGLHFVKKIIDVHNGTIELDVGSIHELNGSQIATITFRILVPRIINKNN